MTDERVVAHTGGEKGTKLARFDLIPSGVEEALAEHFGKGASKYEDRNWERGYPWSLSYAALRRHLAAFWRGEDIDEDGHNHIDAVLWHAVALVHFTQHERYAEFDNRPEGISEQLQLAFEPMQDVILPPVEVAQRLEGMRFDQYIVREDEWKGNGRRHKGSDNPIAHDGKPVYRTDYEQAVAEAEGTLVPAAVDTTPPSVVWSNAGERARNVVDL